MAAKKTPQVEILTGGYTFSSSYSLHCSSPGMVPSDLIVDVLAGRGIIRAKNHSRPIRPSMFEVQMRFTINNAQGILKASLLNGHKSIRKKNIKSSSTWYPGLKKLLKKVMTCLDIGKRKNKSIGDYKKEVNRLRSPHFHIKQLPGSTLHSRYLFRSKTPLSKRPTLQHVVFVKVITAFEIINEYGDKPILTATITSSTQRSRNIFDLIGTIKFAKTKNGLQEITQKNIKHSSKWYSSIKKIANKSVRQYYRFKKLNVMR